MIKQLKTLLWLEFAILFAGSAFAWTNFGIELSDWLHDRACSVGCTADATNPFLTPCFYGANVFTLAFAVSGVILRKYLSPEKAARR